MARYLIRRLLAAIPTVFGVVLITFVLFNVVGGSPASMALGKNASPQALEEFDEGRGFNKPLLCGWWTRTRAWEDWSRAQNAGPWRAADGITFVPGNPREPGRLVLAPGQTYAVPLAFDLRPGTEYRWRVTYRLAAGGDATWSGRGDGGSQHQAGPVATDGWRVADFRFRAVAGAGPELRVAVSGAPLEIRALALRRRMGNPVDSQLTFYLGRLARLDFGVSVATNQRVARMLKDGILPSLSLTVPIFLGGLCLALVLSLVCAYFRDRWPDRVLVFGAVVLMSVNYLVWIVAGQYVLAYRLGWFPVWGHESWRYLLLPVGIGIASGLGGNLRFYRTVMLDEMYKDYVRTAVAKGLHPAAVLFKHVLRNALIPVITSTMIALPFLYTGSLLLETFFGIPGLGNLSVNAINSADVEVVRGVVLIGALLYVAANILTDLCYVAADPRVRLR